MKTIRVLVVEDHPLVRAGIRALLQAQPGIKVIAETATSYEALGLVAAQKPDVVLADMSLPGISGLDLGARIVKDFPGVRVLILSMHSDSRHLDRAVRAGVAGFVSKTSPGDLEPAIRAVMAGETWFGATTGSVAAEQSHPWRYRSSARPTLTDRQRQILRLIAEGYSTKEIAQLLYISVKTAETHRTQLMRRLDIHDVASLVRYAVRTGLVAPEE